MGWTLYVLLAVLIGASSIQAKAIDVKAQQEDIQLFFSHNKTLVKIVVPKDGQVKKSIIINEEVTDYALDELNDRIFWVSKNGSVFVKSIYKETPDQLVFTLSNGDAKIDYDMITDKLYFTDKTNVMVLDLKYLFYTLVIEFDDVIDKIYLDPEIGVMYVHARNKQDPRSHLLFNSGMDGNKFAGLAGLYQDRAYVAIDFETKHFDFYNNETAIEGNQIYTIYSSDDKSHNVIRACGPKKICKTIAFLDAFDVNDIKKSKNISSIGKEINK